MDAGPFQVDDLGHHSAGSMEAMTAEENKQADGDCDRPAQRRAIIVLGMHRSGTSALTRVISLAGADLPRKLLPAVPNNNERGFWEPEELVRLHDELLASAGSSWNDPCVFPHRWYGTAQERQFQDRALAVLEGDFAHSALFVLKDPRICRLVPFWMHVLERFGAEPHFVILLRNPLEVAASLESIWGYSTARSALLWLRHVLDAERASRGLSRSIVSFEELLGDWQGTLGKIERQCGLCWPKTPSQTNAEVEAFLSAELRHHRFMPADVAARTDLVGWIPRAYTFLCQAVESGAAAVPALDAIAAEVGVAEAGFGATVGETARESAQRSEKIVRIEEESELRHQHILRLEEEVRLRREGQLRLEAEVCARDSWRVQFQREANLRLTELQSEVNHCRGEIAQLQGSLSQHDAKVAKFWRLGDNVYEQLHEELKTVIERFGAQHSDIAGEMRQLGDDLLQQLRLQLKSIVEQFGAQHGVFASELRRFRDDLLNELQLEEKQRLEQIRQAALHRRVWRLGKRTLAQGLRWKERAVALAGHWKNRTVAQIGRLPWVSRIRSKRRTDEHLQALCSKIVKSGLFDREYYLACNAEVAASGEDPLLHFVRIGAGEGRNPHPLFDVGYYLEEYPDVAAAEMNPLLHYLEYGAAEGRNPHPLFDTRYYLRQNPDVAAAGDNALQHYVKFGMGEARLAFSRERVCAAASREVGLLAPCYSYAEEGGEAGEELPRDLQVGVIASSKGNFFFQEIQDLLVHALRRCGVQAAAYDESVDPRRTGDYPLVIAPHEFFYLGQGTRWAKEEVLGQCVLLSTEQPQTVWFARALPLLYRARQVLEMNLQSAGILRQIGLDAYFLPLGHLERYAPFANDQELPDTPAMKSFSAQVRQYRKSEEEGLGQRPIDVFFVGTLSPRRERFFASSAGDFSRYRTAFFLPSGEAPLIAGQGETVSTAEVIAIAQRAKILLNVHRDEFPYLEWQRLVFRGIWQNTVVVTEPSFTAPGLVPNRHYVECSLEEMPARVQWLLSDPEGQAAAEVMRREALQALKRHYDLPTVLRKLLVRVVLGCQANVIPLARAG